MLYNFNERVSIAYKPYFSWNEKNKRNKTRSVPGAIPEDEDPVYSRSRPKGRRIGRRRTSLSPEQTRKTKNRFISGAGPEDEAPQEIIRYSTVRNSKE